MDGQYLSLLIKLCFVVILFVVAAYFLKKGKIGAHFNNKHFHMISHFSLGSKEKLILVEVNKKKLLLGVTANQIQTLFVFDQEDKTPAPSPSDFAEVLRSTMA